METTSRPGKAVKMAKNIKIIKGLWETHIMNWLRRPWKKKKKNIVTGDSNTPKKD